MGKKFNRCFSTLWALSLIVSVQLFGQPDNNTGKHFKWDEWTVLPDLSGGKPHPGLAGAFSGITNEALIVAGGANFPANPPWKGGSKVWWSTIHVLDKQGSDYQWVSDSTFKLDNPLAYGVSLSVQQGLLCIGGHNENGMASDVTLLTWEPSIKQVIRKNLGALPASFEATGGAVMADQIYVTGITDHRNRLIRIDLDKLLHGREGVAQWEELPACPGPGRRLMSYAAQSNGNGTGLYLFGGRSEINGKITLHSDAYAFNSTNGQWVALGNISYKNEPTIIMGAPAVAYGASTIFLFGGDDGTLYSYRHELEQTIAKAREHEKDSLTVLLRKSFEDHPGFGKTILAYNTLTNTYTEAGDLAGEAPVTTNAILWDDHVILVSGEIKPGVRTAQLRRATLIKSIGSFGTLNYTILIIYLVVLIIIGVYFSFRQKSTNDYFKGGGRVPWWAAGLSVFGTALSAITFMAIPAKTYSTNWSYFLYNMSVLLATPVVVLFFIPFYRRLDVTTAYEYLEKRFNLIVRLLGSASFILFQIGRIAIVLYLPAIALSLVTGIDIYFCILTMGLLSLVYTLIGGIEAVIWTDVIQVFVLMGGTLLSLVFIFCDLEGGLSSWMDSASAQNKFDMLNFDLSLQTPTFWVVVVGGFFANLITYSSDQTLVQRYLTTKDERTAAKTSWTNAVLVIPSSLMFFGVGTALFLFYSQYPDKADVFATGTDAIFPWYIIHELPNGISGLLIAGLFSAAMSSLSSSMNSTATAFTTDFYQRFRTGSKTSAHLSVARLATLASGLLGTLFAIWMSTSNVASLWDQFSKILGLFTGGLGGVFVLGIISRQANGKGAIVGLVASGILQYMVSTFTSIHFFLYAAMGLISCVVIGHVSSLFVRDTSNEQGKTLTVYNKLFHHKGDR